MSNFDFLKDFDETLWKLGNRIEKQVTISPSGVKADTTPFLEHILEKLLNQINLEFNSRKSFYSQLDTLYRMGKISYSFKQRIYSAYQLRNKIHDSFDEIEKNEFYVALNIHEKLFYIAKKYYRDFNENYDEYKGVPSYKPIELDTTDDEIEMIKIPDFSEVVDNIHYDYCVICGAPNHSSYSLCCPKCNRVLDNANNFISIRNSFGKDSQFTKEDLIEFGIPEGYANQFISHLVQENMLKVAGRFITFNNMHFDEYLLKIDSYLSVCELITKFSEDKITPKEIKQTNEYKRGKLKEKPFYELYKIINHEILNKFERDLLTTENIWKSIDYTTISPEELQRWYSIQLRNYKIGNINQSFVVFNNLLQNEYIELKKQGIYESEIKRQLNVTPEIYDFWTKINENFVNEINQIKKDLLLKALNEDKTRQEAIEIAGLTPKEYNDLVKVSEFHNDEFSQKRNVQVETRKQRFIEYIKNNDVETSCNLAKITVEDFYMWYDKDMSSDFYLQTTKILMHNFLNQRRKGKSKVEAAQAIKLECKHVFRWFNRTLDICEKFKNEHIRVTVDLCYQGFKNNKSKKEIAQTADIKLSRLNTYLNLGQRNYGTYKLLYDYYEENIIPKQLSKFLEEIKNKAFKKALEMSELSEEEFKRFYNLGKSGDIKYQEFYYDLSNIKLNTFLKNINKGKTKERALKNSNLTGDELDEFYNMGKNNHEKFRDFYRKFYGIKLKIYIANINRGVEKTKALKNSYLDSDELKEDIDDIILNKNLYNVIKSLLNESTTKLAAKTAGIKIEEIYDWYLKGKSGDEKFSDFADYYYQCYILPGSLMIQNMLREGLPLKHILKKFKKTFTREDYNFWAKHSFLMEANEKLDEVEDEEALIEEILDKSKEYEEKNKNKLLNH